MTSWTFITTGKTATEFSRKSFDMGELLKKFPHKSLKNPKKHLTNPFCGDIINASL